MLLAGVKNQQRVRANLRLLAAAVGKDAVALQNHHIEGRVGNIMLDNALMGAQTKAQDSAVFVYWSVTC